MFNIFKSNNRGKALYGGWLKTNYSFSFANWYEPSREKFGNLRVLNEDYIKEGNGFPLHPHKNMEIITIILDGELTHIDSMGNKKKLKKNYIQHMSAGTGIIHSEMNFGSKECHLLQIWLIPKKTGIWPSYFEKKIEYTEGLTKLIDNEIINQDVTISILKGNGIKKFKLNKGFGLFFFVIEGTLKYLNNELNNGDSLEIYNEKEIEINYNGKILVIEVSFK